MVVPFSKPKGRPYRRFPLFQLLVIVSGIAISILLLLQLTVIGASSKTTTTHSTYIHSLTQFHNNNNSSSNTGHVTTSPIKIAHVVSFIKCQKESRVAGFMDALVVLRHSIHSNSVHQGRGRYSYQMIAFIHETGCPNPGLPSFLRRLGYIPMIVPTPIDLNAIQNDWYRTHVESENCCGSKEFIKLYSYTLVEYPIVVHWDLDVAVLQPLDDLYDAMLHPKDSEVGRVARQRIQRQRPDAQTWPDKVDAFFTRDVTSAKPWERIQAVQGGFVVAKPNLEHFETYRRFILEGNYTKGRGEGSGWAGLGYGGFQGAMAYQGVLAYFYDVVYPGHHVELDVCRWNQVVADVIWRGPDGDEHMHQCRDYPPDGDFVSNTPENGKCEDCRRLPIEETMTVHYTACKKPWECTLPFPRVPGPGRKAHTYRLQELTNVTTCGKLIHRYFEYRRDIEGRIANVTGAPVAVPNGGYYPKYYMGYCSRSGAYKTMDPLPNGFSMEQVYGF